MLSKRPRVVQMRLCVCAGWKILPDCHLPVSTCFSPNRHDPNNTCPRCNEELFCERRRKSAAATHTHTHRAYTKTAQNAACRCTSTDALGTTPTAFWLHAAFCGACQAPMANRRRAFVALPFAGRSGSTTVLLLTRVHQGCRIDYGCRVYQRLTMYDPGLTKVDQGLTKG